MEPTKILLADNEIPRQWYNLLAAGCDGYLEKPINPDTFVADIKRHLSRSKGQESA